MYQVSERELANNPILPVQILGDAGEIFYEMALEMIEEIKKNNTANKHTVLICPVGPTGQYPIFVRLVNKEKISLKNVYFINMDEYLDEDMKWIDKNNPLSFRGFMEREVYDRIDEELLMPVEQRIFPEPGNEEVIWNLIKKLGGVDICFGGVGINGHVAFNEPPEPGEYISNEDFKRLPTRVLKIARETIAINAVGSLGGAMKAMPTWCVTIGMKEIESARKIRLYCFRDWHGAVIREAIYGEMSAACPLSLLRNHEDITLTITKNAAKQPF